MASTVSEEQQVVPSKPIPSTRVFWNGLSFGLVGGLIVLLGLVLVGLFVIDPTNGRESGATDADGMTQTSDGGNVTVKATWEGMAAGPVFRIAMDTHSVDLDSIDLSALAVLRVDGVEAQPVAWDAPKGGHHREGTLTFPEVGNNGLPLIDEATARVELVIRDVAGIPERVLVWTP